MFNHNIQALNKLVIFFFRPYSTLNEDTFSDKDENLSNET